jgi:hypothetical protein
MTAIWASPEPVTLVIVPIEAPVLSLTVSPTVKLLPAVALVFDPSVVAEGALELGGAVDGASEVAGGEEEVSGGLAAPWLGDVVEPAPSARA